MEMRRPETKIDVNVPAITGAQTVDSTHAIDAWIDLKPQPPRG